ncbi:MAG TPA: AIR synthase related protein, partial [Gemmatimonadaceae bacterium]|nr:AIR synthase related protein [Gemmatimonadaceae bacterium]
MPDDLLPASGLSHPQRREPQPLRRFRQRRADEPLACDPMNDDTPLGPGKEFDRVRALLKRWGDAAFGIGDDAALLDVPAGQHLVASADSAVDGVHFRRDWLTPREIGWRVAAAALSDLAAMAANPLAMLV